MAASCGFMSAQRSYERFIRLSFSLLVGYGEKSNLSVITALRPRAREKSENGTHLSGSSSLRGCFLYPPMRIDVVTHADIDEC
jgi:hypothetical protein